MNCPVCSVELRLADRQGVEIDYCPQCRGVWLDRGEMDKIIEKSGSYGDYPREREREREHRSPRHEYDDRSEHYHGKRKKSFLSEIFDFD